MQSAIFKLVMGFGVLWLVSCGGGAVEEVVVGNKAPDFSLQALDGAKVKGRSYEGDIVVLNFWATYCVPCKTEIPELVEVAATTEAKVVGISLDKGTKEVKAYIKKMGINYPVLMGNETVFTRFQGFSIPYTLVLDRKQHIVSIHRGSTTKEVLGQDIQKAM